MLVNSGKYYIWGEGADKQYVGISKKGVGYLEIQIVNLFRNNYLSFRLPIFFHKLFYLLLLPIFAKKFPPENKDFWGMK